VSGLLEARALGHHSPPHMPVLDSWPPCPIGSTARMAGCPNTRRGPSQRKLLRKPPLGFDSRNNNITVPSFILSGAPFFHDSRTNMGTPFFGSSLHGKESSNFDSRQCSRPREAHEAWSAGILLPFPCCRNVIYITCSSRFLMII
jgi:hypothetical protein